MRVELKKLQKETRQTIIYVTHDQIEAMTIADKIAIMSVGRLQQYGTSDEIYSKPMNKFVAGFIGSPPMNFINCTFEENGGAYLSLGATKINVSQYQELIRKQASGAELTLGFRPEDVKVKNKKTRAEDIETTLYLRELLGSKRILHLEFGDAVLKVFAPIEFEADYGSKIFTEIDTNRLYIFDRKTGENIL
jgi:ABC-type sugar transport system ATPase subunit